MTLNTGNKIRLFVTVEQRLYRDTLLIELAHQKDFDLVGESSLGAETLKLLDISKPTTLIIEENLKDVDGLTISEMALSRNPSLTVVLLVDNDIQQNRLAIYLDSGIKSVISKNQAVNDLIQALNYTRNGQVYVDVERYRSTRHSGESMSGVAENFSSELFYSLSEREQEVARFMAEHVPVKNIAQKLGLSDKTIHTYKERILIKLGFERLPELVVFMKRLRFYLAIEDSR